MTRKGAAAATAAGASTATTAAAATPAPLEVTESLEGVIRVLNGLSAQFAAFNAKIGAVDTISKQMAAMEQKFVVMETKLTAALNENKSLREEVRAKEKTIENIQASYANLENKCNEMEQYNRSWSLRVFNIPLTEEEEKNGNMVRDKVYNLALLPILRGALELGEIAAIPRAEDLLEVAHILPGKPGENKPVITRFYNRFMRTLCLRLKRDHAPRTAARTAVGRGGVAGEEGSESGRAGAGPDGRGRYAFPFFEDLTRPTFHKMRALNLDERVQSCWSINGQLRIKLANSGKLIKVNSVYDSVDSIVAVK
jgi:hypothetical protein